MALRNIVQDGDPILKKNCRPVTEFNNRLWELLDDMAETMMEKDGLGLAGPQVGILRRMFIALDETSPPQWLKSDEEDFDDCKLDEEKTGEREPELEEDEILEEFEPLIIEFINPEILEREDSVRAYEGCLSFPGKFGAIARPKRVKIKAFNRDGKEFTMEAEGMMARCICHEMDHLNGLTIDDLAEYFYDPDVPHDLDESIKAKRDKEAE